MRVGLAMPTKEDLSDLVTFLKLVGFWPYFGTGGSLRWFQILRLFLFAQMAFMWILSAYLIGFSVLLNKFYAGVVLCTPYMLIEYALIFWNSDYLLSFVAIMRSTLKKRKKPWQRAIMSSLLDPLWKIIKISTLYAGFLVTMGYVGPILYDTMSTLLFDAESINLDVPVDGLLPSDKNDALYYFLQWFNGFFLLTGVSYFIGLLSILPLLVNYIRIEIKILCRQIEEWGKMENKEQEELLLREIIQDHVNILRLTQVTNKFLAGPLHVQNVASGAAITLFLYSLVKSIFKEHQSITTLLVIMNSPIAMVLGVFLNCYAGELLHSESLLIYEGFCQIYWYKKSLKRQKDILIILMQVQRPLRINFKGNQVDLRAFKQVINATYSYFMLLQSVA